MSRADEIAQGLRDETGALTFPLNVLEYNKGHKDFEAGTPPPRMSSASYDLGRNRAREAKEALDTFWDEQRARQARTDAMIRDLLKDKPEALANYLEKMRILSPSTGDSHDRS